MESGTVRVWRKFAELQNGRRVAGPPKSVAGTRTVGLPRVLVEVMAKHFATFMPEPEELVLRGSKGAALRRSNFHRSVHWAEVVKEAGLPAGFHFHDLRHTGNNLAAASGASTRELMLRMGHGSMRAALIYEHATNQRDREIADALGRESREKQGRCGPWVARRRHQTVCGLPATAVSPL